MSKKPKVILRKCPTYSSESVERIISEGLAELGLNKKIQGRITIKPNVVLAHRKVAPSGYTRPEFITGLLRALEKNSFSSLKISIVEKCGAGVPTSRMFRRAGYYALKREHRVKIQPIEEARKRKVVLKKGKIHQHITTAREIVDNDFLIYAPKLKSNILTQGLTAAVKLNMGILLDRKRMWNHNYNLDEKIVDLLEVGSPDFIATDAVEISIGGNQFTQHAKKLGLIIMADNPLAHDAVCARILHLNPAKIDHLRLAHERGYGPLALEEIEVKGDITLQEIQKKTEAWETGYKKVDEVKTNITVLSGEPYCRGGCQGVFLDWLYMIKDRKPALWKNLPPWTVVIGQYTNNVSARNLMLVGTCTEIKSKVRAKRIRRIRGCPPRHKKIILLMFLKAGILSPMFRLDLIIDAYPLLFFSWCKRFIKARF